MTLQISWLPRLIVNIAQNDSIYMLIKTEYLNIFIRDYYYYKYLPIIIITTTTAAAATFTFSIFHNIPGPQI